MHQNQRNITEKTYRKLVLKIGLTGFAYGIWDTLQKTLIDFREIEFDTTDKTKKIEDFYEHAFFNSTDLRKPYDEVQVIHDNNLNTFVPNALFDESYLGSYMQFNTKVFDTDFFTFDTLESYGMHNVYIPYVHLNNFLIDKFGQFEYRHAASILVRRLLDLTKNATAKKMFVHLAANHFEIIVVHNQRVLLYNSFEYKTPEDVVYYILFTAEQLQLNPEEFSLELIGKISKDSEVYSLIYNYVRHVTFFDVSQCKAHNTYSNALNLQHFILFQSWELFPENTRAVAYLLREICLCDPPQTWAKKPCLIFSTTTLILMD